MAQSGDIRKARMLLDHAVDINAVDDEYRTTPLGMASRWGHKKMVAMLLERGADPIVTLDVEVSLSPSFPKDFR